MSKDQPTKPKKQKALRSALRANLVKRKAQSRELSKEADPAEKSDKAT